MKKAVSDFGRSSSVRGGGNYQTLINDAPVAYIQQRSVLDAVRQVVREEIAVPQEKQGVTRASARARGKRSLPLSG
jgi:hypothetical protein